MKVHVCTYIGTCCREWVLACGVNGRCGQCGERPTFTRDDPAHTCPSEGEKA